MTQERPFWQFVRYLPYQHLVQNVFLTLYTFTNYQQKNSFSLVYATQMVTEFINRWPI